MAVTNSTERTTPIVRIPAYDPDVSVMILDDDPRLELDPYREERLAINAVKAA